MFTYTASYSPARTWNVSCQTPTAVDERAAALNFRHGSRCGSSRSFAKRSSDSKSRQYCTSRVVRPSHDCVRRQPSSGCWASVRIMAGIAVKTGHHCLTFNGLLNRIPIRKTTKSPSMSAVNRPW